MQGIDISNWQKGINLSKVPCDFVIAKATQGTSYTNPDCVRSVEQALSLGKCVGVYHYISGGNANGEADYFVNSVKNWIGKVILCLDWEQGQNSAWDDESYLKKVAQRVIERTGVKPLIYVQKSRMSAVQPVSSALNCGLWIAQYANNKVTGYQDKPWNEGAYSCVIRQYSSAGRLNGWSGNLDLNKAYISAQEWAKYANPQGTTEKPSENPKPSTHTGSTLDLAVGVMQGKYGTGNERKKSLGSRYNEVQEFINHISKASANTLASEVKAGKYGNGDTRKTVLGSRYDEVQAIVNGNKKKTIDEIAREVIAGKWGVNPERKKKLIATGYDYNAVQKRVNQLL